MKPSTKKTKKAKKAKKERQDKRKEREVVAADTIASIELSDDGSQASYVPIAPLTAQSYFKASRSQVSSAEIKKLLDNQGRLMYRFDQLIERFEMLGERIEVRLKAVEDKLFATLDVNEEKSFIQACLINFRIIL
ncbi:7743_t:CDS:2 [Cetraspora pellucida]|uniref:7743_t:CDS:1 n=1 Tax=Cetraspora pellucida TaxID=1433469 RepID=A0ACA9LEN4_9GLOM|nr:7743_t:CDS:2 [Cetraspora pellucida]